MIANFRVLNTKLTILFIYIQVSFAPPAYLDFSHTLDLQTHVSLSRLRHICTTHNLDAVKVQAESFKSFIFKLTKSTEEILDCRLSHLTNLFCLNV